MLSVLNTLAIRKLSRGQGRHTRGAVYLEYAIGITAAAMITLGAAIPFFTNVKETYEEFSEILEAPAVFIIRQDGMSYSHSNDNVDEEESNPTGWVGDDETSQPSSPPPEPEPEPEPDPEPETDSPGVCPAWSYFNYGFVKTQTMVQIHVPGKIIGIHGTKGNPKKKKDDSIDLEDVSELGDEYSTFVLAIEYDGVHEHFTDHNRISVFSLHGEKIINRALVKYEEPGDIRQGDEYIVAHTKDLIIDLSGTLFGSKEYNASNQTGNDEVGNNDTYLSFHDIGCVIYRPED